MAGVFVRGLEVECVVGILPEERTVPQSLVVDLELELDLTRAGREGDLSLSVDYAALAGRVRSYARARRAGLLEELGYELCTLILKEFSPRRVTVRLTKPRALEGAAGAGIEITATANCRESCQ